MASTPRSITYPVGSDSGDIAAHMADLATTTDAAITTAVPTGFKNVLINGNFDVWQRGSTLATVTSTATFNADRWGIESQTNTATPTKVQPTQAEFEAMKKPGHTYSLQIATTAANATSDYTILFQRIEDVRTLAGQQVTLSFWAKASSGTPKIGIDMWRYYGPTGSGGSAADSSGNIGTVTISTTLTRYSITFTMPSLTSKTVVTDGNSYVAVNLWLTSGSAQASRAGSIGQQTNTFTITDIQLERGPVATSFDHRSRQQELSLCQRYYQKSYEVGTAPGTATSTGALTFYTPAAGTTIVNYFPPAKFNVTMRTAAAMTVYSTAGTINKFSYGGADASQSITSYPSDSSSGFRFDATVTANVACQIHWVANAEL